MPAVPGARDHHVGTAAARQRRPSRPPAIGAAATLGEGFGKPWPGTPFKHKCNGCDTFVMISKAAHEGGYM